MRGVDRSARMLSLDPGSRTMGLAIVEYDYLSKKRSILFTVTLDVDEGLKSYRQMEEVLGTRPVRLKLIKEFLTGHLQDFQPDIVVMESPFAGSNVQAFKILVDVMKMIEEATTEYGANIALLKIDPPTVKKVHGVPGNSSDKSLMLAAVSNVSELELSDGLCFKDMSEHEIDAIAVANWCVMAHLDPLS